jgi:hypothetical protein
VPLLYYWRPDNYRRDRDFGFGYHLNQNSPAMERTGPGDSLWAFTRYQPDGRYVLAAELVVRAVTRNPPRYRYGRFRIWGDVGRSRYFDTDVAPNAEPLIRALDVKAQGERLGQSFQGAAAVRVISAADHRLLSVFARDLVTLQRAAVYPEDEFEARLIHGDIARPLVLREERAAYDRRHAYLFERFDVQRARRHVEHLQETYAGRCQLCRYDPRRRYGHALCHGHHIRWLSRGGEDDLDNLMLLCPNHHAAVHRDDAPFDFASLTFAYSNGTTEPVLENRHLPRAA